MLTWSLITNATPLIFALAIIAAYGTKSYALMKLWEYAIHSCFSHQQTFQASKIVKNKLKTRLAKLIFLHFWKVVKSVTTYILFCIENLYFWVEFSIVFFCMYYSKMVIGYCLLIRLVFTLTISVSRSQRLRDLTPFALVENVFCKLPTVICAFSPLYKLAKKVGQREKCNCKLKNGIPSHFGILLELGSPASL